jgi:geranylgeranyl reductase family protein
VIDVLVVGAGPAGVAAAVTARRTGRQVVLLDKATFPRDKCCGDGLTTLALRELEALGFDPATVADFRPVDGAVLRAPSGRTFKVPLPTDAGIYAAVAPRLQFDAALVDLAVEAGVEVRLGHAVKSAAVEDGTVSLGVEGLGDLAARHVVAADGMWSPTRKALGLGGDGYLGEWHAVRQYVGGVTGRAADELIVWFEEDLLPGYAWSFPLPDGRANVGFGVLRDGSRTGKRDGSRTGERDGSRTGKEVNDLWAGLLDRPHVAAALGPSVRPEGRHLAWPIPARIDRAVLSHGPVLFTGDAAAATDVMTGEGIGQALLTGRLAAAAIGDGGTTEAIAARYRDHVRSELVADHRMSVLLGRVLRHRRGANGALAIVAHSGGWGRRSFARWMFEDEPRAIAVTPKRWHRRPLSRPGPYAGR